VKYKFLSAVIAAALLSGCNDADTATATVQAYDPAVANMDVKYACDGGTMGTAGVTDGYGKAKISNNVFALNTEDCNVTFVARSNSVDMSNGKSMAGVVYKTPRGMAISGQKLTGSPLSTLLAKTLGDAPYTEAAATQLLTDLGLGSLLTSGVSLALIFLDTEGVVAALPAAEKSKLLATTAIVSDVVKNAESTASVADITAAAEAITVTTLSLYPDYPINDTTGEPIYLEIPKDMVDTVVADPTAPISEDDLPVPEDAVVQDPNTPPTGGTGGGTGGGGNGGGTGS
jgi:hypothetical protein